MLPGDLPLVQPQTLRAVAFGLQDHAVVVPVHAGTRGHPVGFFTVCRDLLLSLKGNQGAALVVRAHTVIEIVVDDVGIYTDIDTV